VLSEPYQRYESELLGGNPRGGDGMTREEKINHLKGILSEINENDNAVCYLTSEDNELIESAIEALEQEPILDKIRAEIIEYEGDCRLSDDESPSCKECTDNVFKTIYGIIDKYKAESEEP
jgi:hypothetical protein